MAVQARDLSLKLADLRNGPSQFLENGFANADECARRDNSNFNHPKLPANYRQQIPQQAACSTMMFTNSEKWLATPMRANESALKKRKDSSKPHAEKRPRIQTAHQMSSCAAPEELFNEALSLSAMRLSLGKGDVYSHVEDDSSIVTSSRSNTVLPVTLSSRLFAQISKQQNEISDLLKIQTEQLRLVIEERTRLHSKTFLATVGEGLSRRLRARDMELERMSQKNMELEQKVNHLSLETQAWQSKAWSYDAMVSALRANLQQALMHQTRCQVKMEGFGESDNDASSPYVDEVAAQQTRATPAMTSKAALQRACKKCKSKEVSILLLPCLHLCVCSECRDEIERCPACNFQICDRVEVYLT